MEALGINIGYLIMQILGITILVLLLKGLLYGPMIKVLEERKARIAKGLEDARQAAVARDNADAEAKKVLDAARVDASKLRQDAAGQAEEQAKVILAKANEDAKEVIHNARTEAEGERNKILAELRSQVAAISMAAANKLVGEALDEKRQRALLADFFAKVPDSVAGLSGSKAEVTSALPLTNEEMAQVKASVNAADVSFKVNPKILGGLIVRVDDRVVDNSVAGQMANLADSLK
ncbi:MAG: F0F1 ATP synthase subunit B [Chloroflexi bacterium]|nr:F0F1 ATP synthase subunit B [Chloroflexota bacterium]